MTTLFTDNIDPQSFLGLTARMTGKTRQRPPPKRAKRRTLANLQRHSREVLTTVALSSLLIVQEVEADITAGNRA